MAATSLKLPEPLKKRLARLAANAGQTPHAFMVDTLAREAERAELREQFAEYAAESEREVLESGKSIPLDEAFNYLQAKVEGRKVKRPKARPWRASR